MASRRFYIVDVFAQSKYAGNQLAVFRDASNLSDSEMQAIAREMNFSETTFIMSDTPIGEGFNVRIFTPNNEILFAGHPTLGTAFIIQREIIGSQVDTVKLNLKVGQIPVSMTYLENGLSDVLWMKQVQPEFMIEFDPDEICEAINLNRDDLDQRFPIQGVSTGLPFIIVPVKTLSAVENLIVDKPKYFDLVENVEPKAILAFCPETLKPENDLHARVFVDYYGIPEDPATGSANGCLASYLVKHKYFGRPEIDVRVEQGYEMGRPSLLLLKAEADQDDINVRVGGSVVSISRGEFL